MSSFEVKIRQISAIEPIEGADFIELAKIDDYRCVVRKGQYKEQEFAVYIPEQAIVPQWLLEDLSLVGKLAGPDKNRVKACKFKKSLSQGLLVPIEKISDGQFLVPSEPYEGNQGMGIWTLEQDLAEGLGIIKYEPPIPQSMAGEICNIGNEHTIKYDIENLKRFPNVLQEGEEVFVTEKLHGCLDGKSQIMLPNGEYKSIREIVSDTSITHILSFDVETKNYIPKIITNKLSRPNLENKKWMKLTFENNKHLILTEDHPVYSKDRQSYISAKDLLENENIESPIK